MGKKKCLIRVDEDCSLVFFPYFPEISVFLGIFLYIGEKVNFGKILKKTEKYPSLRSTLTRTVGIRSVTDASYWAGSYLHQAAALTVLLPYTHGGC